MYLMDLKISKYQQRETKNNILQDKVQSIIKVEQMEAKPVRRAQMQTQMKTQ